MRSPAAQVILHKYIPTVDGIKHLEKENLIPIIIMFGFIDMMKYEGTWSNDWNGAKLEIYYLYGNSLQCEWKEWASDSRNILDANDKKLTWAKDPSIEGNYGDETITWCNGNTWRKQGL